MEERDQGKQPGRNSSPDDLKKNAGNPEQKQKKPEEDIPQATGKLTWNSLKGKAKEDGDPSLETDQPVDLE